MKKTISQLTNWSGGIHKILQPGELQLLVAYPGVERNHKQSAALSILASAINLLEIPSICNQHKNANNFQYSDTGLFSISISSPEGHDGSSLNSLTTALNSVAQISNESFENAKSVTRTGHLHSLFDTINLAKQIAETGRVNDVQEINAVTHQDFKDVVSTLTRKPRVIVASGDVRGINQS